MPTNEALKAEVAESIRNDPQLMQAIREATEYLDTSIGQSPVKRATDQAIRWNLVDSAKGSDLEVNFSETDRYGGRKFQSRYSAKQFQDPYCRRSAMNTLFRNVLRDRSSQISLVIDQLIRELKEEEANG